jgi:hypothetical protein
MSTLYSSGIGVDCILLFDCGGVASEDGVGDDLTTTDDLVAYIVFFCAKGRSIDEVYAKHEMRLLAY